MSGEQMAEICPPGKGPVTPDGKGLLQEKPPDGARICPRFGMMCQMMTWHSDTGTESGFEGAQHDPHLQIPPPGLLVGLVWYV